MSKLISFPVLPAARAAFNPNLLSKVWRGECDGFVLRDVYSPDECAIIVQRLERGAHRLIQSNFPQPFKSFFLGLNLNLLPFDLDPYFAQVAPFHRALDELFAGMPSPRQRVPALLSSLDGGRPYTAARGSGRGEHMVMTLRGHRPGGFLPPHFDDEQAFRPGYRFILPQVTGSLVSFVLAFSAADEGGETETFNFNHGNHTYRMVDGPNEASHLARHATPRSRVRLQPGEMLVFRSGRTLHSLSPVGGARTRWTACSFMAEARDGGTVLCWG